MRNAPMINRCDESRDVADDSTANADEERLSVNPRSDHLVTDCASLLKRLRLLACWNRDQCRSRTCRHQTFLDAPGEKWRNVVIGNDRASFASQTLVHMRSNLVQQTRADKYAMTLRIKRNGGAGGPLFYCVGSQW